MMLNEESLSDVETSRRKPPVFVALINCYSAMLQTQLVSDRHENEMEKKREKRSSLLEVSAVILMGKHPTIAPYKGPYNFLTQVLKRKNGMCRANRSASFNMFHLMHSAAHCFFHAKQSKSTVTRDVRSVTLNSMQVSLVLASSTH